MITPDQITNGAVFKLHGYTQKWFIITGGRGWMIVEEDEGEFLFFYDARSKKEICEFLNQRKTTLCPNLKLAVVEKNQQ